MDGQALSEVMKWDLEDVYNYHQFMAMKADYNKAAEGLHAVEMDRIKQDMKNK